MTALIRPRGAAGLFPRIGFAIFAVVFGNVAVARASTVLSYTGNLRTDANFISCGAGCTLGGANSDADYAQWAAVSKTFHVGGTSTMTAVTFSYGGVANGAGAVVPDAGFEPYLSLFDAGGNFLNSTLFGTNCPAGTHISVTLGACFDVLLDGGTLAGGDYQIVISAFENLSFAENLNTGTLADGFTGLGNLAPGENLHYAFDVVLSPSATSVPEPATEFIPAAGLVWCWGCYLKKSKGESKMKNKLLMLAGTLAVVAVLGKFYAVPALAQAVRAAVVKNIDEPGRTPFEDAGISNCDAKGLACGLDYAPVPANKRLVITYVTGQIVTKGNNQTIQSIHLMTARFGANTYFPALIQGFDQVTLSRYWAIAQPILAFAEAGSTPEIAVFGTGIYEADFKITGHLVDLNQ